MSDTVHSPLQDGDLLTYIEGTASAEVVTHIHRCAECTRHVQELAVLETALSRAAYRATCCTPEQLIDYYQGALTGREKLIVAQHLRRCPHCARELALLAQVEREAEVQEGDQGQNWLKRMVATLLILPSAPINAQIISKVRQPHLGALHPQVYQAGELTLILHQQPVRATLQHWDVVGLIHTGGQIPAGIEQARVELYDGPGLIAVTQVSARGQFRIESLEPRTYTLQLLWQDREISCELRVEEVT
ncbi:MAG: hypothetical protein JXA33_05435 [Anaerolineae bacterium]|nr:hypothetical protein [Anaerolineae bacterium]